MRSSKRKERVLQTRFVSGDRKIARLTEQYLKQWKQQLEWKNIRRRLQEYDWTPYKKPRFIMAASTSAAFLLISGGFIHWNMSQTGAWTEVFTNGTYVGMVPNQASTLAQMQRTADGYDVALNFSPVHQRVPSNYDWYSVTQLPESAYSVTLNGKPLVYTSNRAAAKSVISSVESALAPKKLSANAKVQFDGKVSVQKSIIGVANILSIEAAVKYILHPAQSLLTVARGTNPLTNQSGAVMQDASLFSGQQRTQAKVADRTAVSSKQPAPLLNVKVTQVVTKKVKVPYHVKRIKDNRLGVGTVKVTTSGKPGVDQETVHQVYKDGKLVSQQVLKKVVLSQPKEQVEDVGTNAGIATGSWGWPVAAYDVTSPYGPRYLGGRYDFHPGIDIGCAVGTPVYATNNGVVEDAGWNSGGYGIWIKINNGRGIETVFGHLSRVAVHAGETVAKGQLIGYSGDTGFATGPHLHYEVRLNGQHINPTPYM